MTTTDHAAAFMEAVKGIPTNFVVTALNEMTPSVNWRGCSKQHIADTYAASFRGKAGVWDNQQLNKINLRQLRIESLNKQSHHRARKQAQENADEEAKRHRLAERQAREALLADAARWRKLWDEVEAGRVHVVVLNQGEGISEGGAITDGGGLTDHIDGARTP